MDSNEAELKRIEAEKGRVLAEGERRHAESNEGTGRVEAELDRRAAEDLRKEAQEEYLLELEKLRSDPQHYITPGARKAFNNYRNKAIVGYLILAAACIMGIYSVSKQNKESLRDDINRFAQVSCLASRQPTSSINKYNDLVEHQIQTWRQARELNLARGDLKRAGLNTKAIIRLQADKIPIPTAKECSAPILK